MEERFTKIYDKSVWGKNWEGKGGSGKGDGTSPDSTFYINHLTNIIKQHNIKRILDIGCGDWKFSRFINWKELDCEYVGCDVVKSVIDDNISKYANDNVSFIHADILTFNASGYDLVCIKDVLQHFADKDVVCVMDKLINHNKYILSTNGYKFGRKPEKNSWTERSIENPYSYHPLDIYKEPFIDYEPYLIDITLRRYKQIILLNKI